MKEIILLLLVSVFIFTLVPSAKALETEIITENFESSTENWMLEDGWKVVQKEEELVLSGNKHSFATFVGASGVVQTLEAKINLVRGGIHLNIREDTPGGRSRYFVGLRGGHSYIQKEQTMNFQELTTSNEGISLNEWHEIKIEIIETRINVYLDGKLLLSAQDPAMLTEGSISFETLEDSLAYISDVRITSLVPETRQLQAQDLFPEGIHQGDITLEGREVLVLEQGEFEQFGNIYLKDSSHLIIRDSTLKISRYQRLLNHWGIHLEDRASLEVENSKLMPSSGETLFIIYARDRTKVNLKNSPTKVHLFSMFGNAKAIVENSEIVGEIGGLVSAYDNADIKVINSKIGAVNLYIPNGVTFEASGLRTGFFENWNLHKDTKIEGINYNLTLINTELVEDTIGPGPFERGWPTFIDSGAKVKIKDSELRKVVITLNNEKAEFSNFYLEKPSNFDYKDIFLENVKVMGQWGVFIHGNSDVVVRDSDAFWTFIFDEANLTLINTHMNEFDPRNFKGKLIFDNAKWDTAAEIIENNDFTMKGTIEIGEIGGFSWETSKVTRTYELMGKPNSEITLKKGEEIVWQGKTDEQGKASFNITFDDTTFDDTWLVQDNFGHKNEIGFFSKTPFDIQQKIKSWTPKNQPSPFLKLLAPALAFLFLVVLFFYIRKRFQRRKK